MRSDGTPERDYLYVDDAVDVYLSGGPASLDVPGAARARLERRPGRAGLGARPRDAASSRCRALDVEPDVRGEGSAAQADRPPVPRLDGDPRRSSAGRRSVDLDAGLAARLGRGTAMTASAGAERRTETAAVAADPLGGHPRELRGPAQVGGARLLDVVRVRAGFDDPCPHPEDDVAAGDRGLVSDLAAREMALGPAWAIRVRASLRTPCLAALFPCSCERRLLRVLPVMLELAVDRSSSSTRNLWTVLPLATTLRPMSCLISASVMSFQAFFSGGTGFEAAGATLASNARPRQGPGKARQAMRRFSNAPGRI